jgi:hypothetical protein
MMPQRRTTFHDVAPEIWRQLSEQVGGPAIERDGWRQEKAIAHAAPWVVTLDVHHEPRYRHETLFTRFRAPFVNPGRFRFNIYHLGMWEGMAKLLGAQDVPCGDAVVDKTFIIKANDDQKVREFLSGQRLRQLLLSEPDVHLHVRDSGDWFAEHHPGGVDELVLEVEGRVESEDRLKRLFALFAEAVEALGQLEATSRTPPAP